MPVAEAAPRPDIDSALLGETGRECCHGKRRRHEEEYGGEQPERDRAGSGLRGGGQPPDAYDRGDVEQHQVPQVQDAVEFGRLGQDYILLPYVFRRTRL
jgi:hypothetical protein